MSLPDPGFRWQMRYLSKYVFKTHYPLLFLYVPVGLVCAGAAVMTVRGFFAPDVNVNKKRIPWENMEPSHRYKLVSPNLDYKTLQFDKERPKLD